MTKPMDVLSVHNTTNPPNKDMKKAIQKARKGEGWFYKLQWWVGGLIQAKRVVWDAPDILVKFYWR